MKEECEFNKEHDTNKLIYNKMQVRSYIMFNKFSTKAQFSFRENNFALDYDHEDADSIFILSSPKGTVVIKESSLDKLEETIRSF